MESVSVFVALCKCGETQLGIGIVMELGLEWERSGKEFCTFNTGYPILRMDD
jgi:hypothetical protein